MIQSLNILFVEDSPTDYELACYQLKNEAINFESRRVDTYEDYLDSFTTAKPDLIVSDYYLPEIDCLQALEIAHKFDPGLPFIVLTGSLDEETAVMCLKAGAFDYVIKEHLYRLPFAIQEALEFHNNYLGKIQAETILQQQFRENRCIAELSQALRISEDEESLVKTFFSEILHQFGIKNGVLVINDPYINVPLPRSAGEIPKNWDLFDLTAPRGLIRTVMETNKAYVTEDLKNDPLMPVSIQDNITPDIWGICLPLHYDAECFGAILLMSPLEKAPSNAELSLLTKMMEIGAQTLQRIRLLSSLERINQSLQLEVKIRSEIENLLAGEKERLSISLESIGEGIISVDNNGVISLFNSSAAKITGFKAEQALGKPLEISFKILDRHTHQTSLNPIGYLFEDQERKKLSSYRPPTLETADGTKILVSASISPVKIGDNSQGGYIIVFDNVTDQELMLAQSTLSQKLEAIGQLAAGIAHEINTPIQYVGDNVNFLHRALLNFQENFNYYHRFIHNHLDRIITQSDLQDFDGAVRRLNIQSYSNEFPAAVEETLDGLDRVRKIVLAIREFSHPSDKEKHPADINQGIQTTITLSRNEWKYYADLETDLAPDLPLIFCQIDEINQVVLNMIVNAAQAIQDHLPKDTEAKGKISIKTRLEDNRLVISIQDTGGGIPEAIINRIFDPFFTTKGIGRGTGQGLSIAHNIIVNKHNGQIQVHSIPGEGTTFKIIMPVTQGASEEENG